MSKSELIKRLAIAHPRLQLRHIALIVDTVIEQIGAVLARGARVELRGFGTFSTRARGARLGRNPRTGSTVAVLSKAILHFKVGKDLLERLNPIK